MLPPPPPPIQSSGKVQSLELSNTKSIIPYNPYIFGLPIQYSNDLVYNKFRVPSVPKLILNEFEIDYDIHPFTYLNFSNLTNDPSPQLILKLYNVPIGSIFIINGPVSWILGQGIIQLEDNLSLPNAAIDIPNRTTYKNIMIMRNSTGLVGSPMV